MSGALAGAVVGTLAGGVWGMIAFRLGSTAMWSIVLAGAIFFALVALTFVAVPLAVVFAV